MHRFVIAVFAAAAIASPAMAQTHTKTTSKSAKHAHAVKSVWREVYHDSNMTVMVDTTHIRKLPDGTYSTHLRWTYAKDQSTEGHKYRSMTETRIIDCNKVRSKSLRAVAVDRAGKKVSSFATPDSEIPYLMWSVRKPGTANATALDKTCTILRAHR